MSFYSVSPFLTKVSVLYPLEESENLWFSYVFRGGGYRKRALV